MAAAPVLLISVQKCAHQPRRPQPTLLPTSSRPAATVSPNSLPLSWCSTEPKRDGVSVRRSKSERTCPKDRPALFGGHVERAHGPQTKAMALRARSTDGSLHPGLPPCFTGVGLSTDSRSPADPAEAAHPPGFLDAVDQSLGMPTAMNGAR
ncbi:hypothetical protein C8Q70DRAFT_77069 [Cubamyces menziesii]|nr:hypothetical protein C8Q70DRAFT_77069 [Cubamyces menziesii]